MYSFMKKGACAVFKVAEKGETQSIYILCAIEKVS